MKTIQGRNFDYSDIVLYTEKGEKIVLFVGFEDQIEKYNKTKKISDAPVAIENYTAGLKETILSEMKRIKRWTTNQSKERVTVTYADNSRIKFSMNDLDKVKKVSEEQRKYDMSHVSGDWSNLEYISKKDEGNPDVANASKQEVKKNNAKKTFFAGVATTLAAITVACGIATCSRKQKNDASSNIDVNPRYSSSRVTPYYNPRISATATPEPIRSTATPVPIRDTATPVPVEATATPYAEFDAKYEIKSDAAYPYDFNALAEKLFNETKEKNTFILNYQDVTGITWNQELAQEVVQIINGVYPSNMLLMNEKDAAAEMSEALQAIELLVAGNINPETKDNDVVELSNYVVTTKERVLVHNTEALVRNVVNESKDEPMNGKLLLTEEEIANLGLNPCNPEDVEFINKEYMKFSRQFLGSVDEMLHYENRTVNSSDFLIINSGCRFLVNSYFMSINGIIPQWSYVLDEKEREDGLEVRYYYRYFMDDVEKKTYLPREGKNGTTEYYYSYTDKKDVCHEETYTEDEMFAMAGIDLTDEGKNYKIEVNPNLHLKGIGLYVTDAFNKANEELIDSTLEKGKTK